MTLYGDFLGTQHRHIHKWHHYFAVYERHFERFRNQHVTVFEIGVGEGGSLQLWRRYLGPFAVIVGIDISPVSRQVEEDQVYVRTGNQTDTAFLATVLAEFGNPDIVIDDGSHIQSDIATTFDFLFPYVAKNGVYLVEDLHAAYWPNEGGGLRHPDSFIERAKGFVDQMHAEYTWAHYVGGALPRSALGDRVRSIHFHDSVIVFEVGEYRPKREETTGTPGFDWHWQPPAEPRHPPLPPPPLTVAAQTAPQAVLDQIVHLHERIRHLEAAAPPPAEAVLRERVGTLEAEVAAVRRSTSWRITRPLRALARLVRR
jgi:hypothetical protein